MKKLISLILIIVMLLVCSGCSLNFFSVESLMSPPAQSGKNGDVEKAFKKLMSDKTIQLRTPVSGDYQTAFVLYDLNGNGIEEALVFYNDSSVDASVRIAFLECVNDTWVISGDVKGAGSGVYDVSFSDLDDNGCYEILVGWTLYDSNSTKIVSVYEITPGDKGIYTLNTLGNEYYSAKSIMDFNGDDKEDLVLVYLDDSQEIQKSYFRCFSLSDNNEFVKYAESKLDSLITSVSKIQFDVIENGKKSFNRIFIDCSKTDSSTFTEMLYWDYEDKAIVRAYKNPSKKTLRHSKINCSDIDGDGILEIPSNTTILGDEKLLTVKKGDNQYTFTMIKWLNAYGDKSEGNINTLFNPLDLYLYRLTRVNEVTVYYDILSESLKFCLWDKEEKLVKEELLSISYRDAKNTLDAEGQKLSETDNGQFYFNITDHGKRFGLTDEGVKTSFIIIK